MSTLTFGSLCSGIEAASAAWHPLGWRTAFVAEIEPFPCAVLAHHYPDVPNLGDMTKINGADWRDKIAVLVAGTPCQAFSVAGKRESLGDDRGNLTLVFCELVHDINPAFVVWENVPGVLSTKDNAFGCFLARLVGASEPLISGDESGSWPSAGMVAGPVRTAAWRILDAQYFGLAQRRRRVFVVSCRTGDGHNPGAILFEPESLPRDSAPSRETGARVAASLTRGADSSGAGGYAGRRREDDTNIVGCLDQHMGAGGPDDNAAQANHLVPQGSWEDPSQRVAPTLDCAFADKWGLDDQHINSGAGLFVPSPKPVFATDGQSNAAFSEDVALALNATNEQPYITHALRADGFDASEDGTGRGTPLVPVAFNWQNGGDCRINPSENVANGLQRDQTQAIAFAQNTRDEVRQINGDGQIVGALGADVGAKQQSYVAFQCHGTNVGPMGHLRAGNGNETGGVPFIFQTRCSRNGRGMPDEVAPALTSCEGGTHADTKPHVAGGGMAVRRLTPRECERLQGFPDDYTLIRFRGKPAADGPRYRAIGNSKAVPVVRWIGERIEAFIKAVAP